MKELDPAVFVAVFQEMLGWMFWPLVAVIVLGGLAFLFVLVRDRRIVGRRLLVAELGGLAGGVFGVWFMQWITNSGFRDIGGPIDVVLVIGIFAAGLIGGTILSYVLLGLIGGRAAARA
jgi:hypothetical protein